MEGSVRERNRQVAQEWHDKAQSRFTKARSLEDLARKSENQDADILCGLIFGLLVEVNSTASRIGQVEESQPIETFTALAKVLALVDKLLVQLSKTLEV